MKNLQQLYYVPILIIVSLSVGNIGLQIYTNLTVDKVIFFLCLTTFGELAELGYNCAMGTLVDLCVRIITPENIGFALKLMENILLFRSTIASTTNWSQSDGICSLQPNNVLIFCSWMLLNDHRISWLAM